MQTDKHTRSQQRTVQRGPFVVVEYHPNHRAGAWADNGFRVRGQRQTWRGAHTLMERCREKTWLACYVHRAGTTSHEWLKIVNR